MIIAAVSLVKIFEAFLRICNETSDRPRDRGGKRNCGNIADPRGSRGGSEGPGPRARGPRVRGPAASPSSRSALVQGEKGEGKRDGNINREKLLSELLKLHKRAIFRRIRLQGKQHYAQRCSLSDKIAFLKKSLPTKYCYFVILIPLIVSAI